MHFLNGWQLASTLANNAQYGFYLYMTAGQLTNCCKLCTDVKTDWLSANTAPHWREKVFLQIKNTPKSCKCSLSTIHPSSHQYNLSQLYGWYIIQPWTAEIICNPHTWIMKYKKQIIIVWIPASCGSWLHAKSAQCYIRILSSVSPTLGIRMLMKWDCGTLVQQMILLD